MLNYLSPSILVMLALSVLSTGYVLMREGEVAEGKRFWVFSRSHQESYKSFLAAYEKEHGIPLHCELLAGTSMSRRLLASFYSGASAAELVEVHSGMAAGGWRGPPETAGYHDLKPLLEAGGWLERINQPSFSPWSANGAIYGLPHDVHPVLLCYRADLLEEAGIDAESLTTWDAFIEACRPLVQDLDGDGHIDRYVLELPYNNADIVNTLLLQAGGGYLDAAGELCIDSEVNARALSKMASWGAKPNPLTADLPMFTGTGHKLINDGYVLAWLLPDWRSRDVRVHMKDLKGKVRVMPLPAFEEGGRRTSVYGGTMIGLPKVNGDVEENFKLACNLYYRDEQAIELFRNSGIISPLIEHWSLPVYQEPQEHFGGQVIGQLYIEQAPHVPMRNSSPYVSNMRNEIASAYRKLLAYASDEAISSEEALYAKAHELLQQAEVNIERILNRERYESEVPAP